ncbi:hypothetical protein [Halpernia frigidisoli]|uniref:Uncharacterized protein n=1 Tax=Halpernia frigidisoli TaxID=1125876 RepID=A0A1I3I3D7_9FLAO|nr:hypothetical protein [Halpernia frigidisoli]SFI42508.1 hypothetical protein SAMN05443292_2542 [Halpernia frigidisoli]
MNNQRSKQAILSFAALACLLIGWLQPFSPPVNYFIYNQLFYVLIGASFFFQAPTLSNPKMIYPMYAAAALCVIGAFIPENMGMVNYIKTIGLLGGVIISLVARPRVQR